MRLTICTSAQVVTCSLFQILSKPTNEFYDLDHALTKRGFWRVGKAKKRVSMSAESTASKDGGLGVFIAPLEKLAVL